MAAPFVLFAILALALVPSESFATLHQELSSALLETEFDYIIVGGGAAGSVLANRLSEDGAASVILLEAGSSDYNATEIQVPGLVSRLPNTRFDWNFTTVAQPGYNGRTVEYARGHVLSGSTAINNMAFCRGSRDDYDRWANVTGDAGWSWDALYPYMLNLDRQTSPADGHNTTGQFDPAFHGETGLLKTTVEGFSVDSNAFSLSAADELGGPFGFNLDYNSGDTIGLSWAQSTVYNGSRDTAAQAFIEPALARPNLDVVVNTQVARLKQTGTKDGIPVFRGVEIQTPSNKTVILQARREVILSAGAVKSPHLLMLSGIGDNQTLKAAGVTPVVDLPDVGQNLQDHVLLTLIWNVNSSIQTGDALRTNKTLAAEALAEWESTRQGPLVNGGGSTWGWYRVPANSSVFDTAADPSAGNTSAHFEFIFDSKFISYTLEPPETGGFFSLVTNLISPASRGNITIASADPFEYPIINPSFLSAPVDLAIMIEAIKTGRTFMSAPAWNGWLGTEYGSFANATTDAQIEEFIRDTAFTVNHVCGTVPMGAEGCIERGCGALNPDLTVKGTAGLRVVDASAFPYIISGHTQGPTYILASRAADIIKESCR